jgi:hypothetical protein
MGKTSFLGPVYGAKQTLVSISQPSLSSGAGAGISTFVHAVIVPPGEDWYLTEFGAFRGSTGSSVTAFWVQDDATVVSSVTMTSTTANVNALNIITPDGGEYEGTRAASGSTITFWYSNASAQGQILNAGWTLNGYRRFLNSTRAE